MSEVVLQLHELNLMDVFQVRLDTYREVKIRFLTLKNVHKGELGHLYCIDQAVLGGFTHLCWINITDIKIIFWNVSEPNIRA